MPAASPHLGDNASAAIADSLNGLLADAFALYLKTKNFHWHVSGPHFRDYHLLLDEQADEIFAITDDIAERVRKVGRRTLTSIGSVASRQRIADNNAERLDARAMLAELMADNRLFLRELKAAHDVADEHDDEATASLIENWIDEAERRVWFLAETLGEDAPDPLRPDSAAATPAPAKRAVRPAAPRGRGRRT